MRAATGSANAFAFRRFYPAKASTPRNNPNIAVLHRLLRARPVAEATGYVYEGRLRGLDEPAKAGFAAKSRGLQPPGFNNLGRLAIGLPA